MNYVLGASKQATKEQLTLLIPGNTLVTVGAEEYLHLRLPSPLP
tara:strand:+ start:2622 stop:2753 length:132 start_codon:yes stop_codon:yes gene_type:complete